MSPTTTPTQTLERALAELPAKLRVHELAKRAGLTSKEVLAALSAAGVKASSAASSVSADDATAVLTTLLGGDQSAIAQPAETAPAGPAPVAPTEEPQVSTADADNTEQPDRDPGFFSAPLFLPPAEVKPARRRRTTKAAADSAPEGQPALTGVPADSAEIADGVPADAAQLDAAAETGTSRSGRRRRGRSGSRGRGGQTDEIQATGDEPAAAAVDTEVNDSPDDTPAADSESDQQLTSLSVDGEPVADVDDDEDGDQARRRRRRGRRGRGRAGDEQSESADGSATEPVDGLTGVIADPAPAEVAPVAGDPRVDDDSDDESGDEENSEDGGTRRRRRRRRRSGSAEPVSDDGKGEDDPDNTVVHVREPRPARENTSSSASEVQGIRGSTRLEAKRQRRRDSRGDRKRPQILTEAEFLARREAVDRVMAVRQRGDLAQVALLEDGILVEHFVSRAGSESLMGNIYLGKVQNVLPSMEAAFVDIGKGRNAVLYAGEVNWDAAGLGGKARRIETALSGGDTILVQVSKDPVGQKGARLTTQISLPGRFLVYVPGGGATGISRKLPDTERKRLKSILDRIVPEDAGVIIRTAAEGVAEEELARDVDRLKSQWDQISRQAEKKSNAPLLLSAEPDTLIKVVRDLFNSDISRLVLDGDRAYEPVAAYIDKVAPELANRVSRYDGPNDVFAAYRIDEQIAKALERKVYLPSGGSLVIDRTEAMTVVDVNTGKYTGSGGNLEETVTKNNLEAAEEVVRQLRLRDIGGIIVVDFIDMVLEANRELVMRRLTECLGRDRTRHQVAEVTSLGLIQMTRKKMGTGLVEAFSEPCPHCQGRGLLLHDVPMEDRSGSQDFEDPNRGRRRGKGRQESTPEPEPIVKLVPAAVRPPDPRGPRPPSRSNGESLELDLGQAAPTPSAADRPAQVETGGHASFNAPRSRDASDAVSAVLAALDAQAAARPAEPVDSNGAADPAVNSAEPAPSGGRRRGRRAAGRPAGAPNVPAVAVASVLDDPPSVSDDPPSVLGDPPSVPDDVPSVPDVQWSGSVDVPDEAVAMLEDPIAITEEPVIDGEVVEQEITATAMGQAASHIAATDRVVAPAVEAREPATEPAAIESVVERVAPGQNTRPARRRAGRPAGAAASPAEAPAAVVTTAEAGADDGNGSAGDSGSGDGGSSIGNGSAGNGSTEQAVPAGASSAGVVANGTVEPPTKAAPRRRRAASRPAGPAGAPVPQ